MIVRSRLQSTYCTTHHPEPSLSKMLAEISPKEKRNMYEVGASVRVFDTSRKYSRRSTIAYYNNEANTYDLIDEDNVEVTRIQCLELFEEMVSCEQVGMLKDQGNTLFQLKDYESAIKYYTRSLDCMQKKYNSPLEIGSRVLVIPQSTAQSLKMRVGIVSADIMNKEKIEIMYDDEGTEDEEVCDIKNIIPIINTKVTVDNGDIGYHIQLALYSNIAKCYLSLKKYGWLIRYSTILITLITTDECEAEGVIDKNTVKWLVNAYYCRIKAFISTGLAGMALKDARKLQKYDEEKGNSMMNEARNAMERKQKENRKLAKEISKWVGQAVQRSKVDDDSDDIAVPTGDDDEDGDQVRETSDERGVETQDKDCILM